MTPFIAAGIRLLTATAIALSSALTIPSGAKASPFGKTNIYRISTTEYKPVKEQPSGMDSVSKAIIRAFRSSFAGVSEVQWVHVCNLERARFTLNGRELYAYFSHDASLIATSRDLTREQLPIAMSRLIDELLAKKRYRDYYFSACFEISLDYSTHYYVLLKSPRKNCIFRYTGLDELEPYDGPLPIPCPMD